MSPSPSPPASARPAAQEAARPAAAETEALARYATFGDVIALIRARREMTLLVEVERGLRLVKYSPGRIEFEPAAEAAPDLGPRLAQRLQSWTGARWGVSIVAGGGAPTIAEERAARQDDLMSRAEAHPVVMAVLAAFPGARIRDIRAAEPEAAPTPPPPEEDDSWDPLDPFDEE